jgi:hypothetical protein
MSCSALQEWSAVNAMLDGKTSFNTIADIQSLFSSASTKGSGCSCDQNAEIRVQQIEKKSRRINKAKE